MKRRGLHLRLTVLYSVIFSIILVGFFLLAYYLLRSQLEASATDELIDRATGIKGYLRFPNGSPVLVYDAEDPDIAFFVRTATRFYQIYDLSSGELLEQSPDFRLLGFELTSSELHSITEFPAISDIDTDEGRLRIFNDKVVAESGKAYLMQVGLSLDPEQQALRHFTRLSLWLLPLGISVAATAGWVMAARALSPIRAITRAAQEIELSQLSRRLPVTGSGDEVDQLATTFNQSFARLEKAVGEMKQFTGSIAHELRTPLAALRGEAEFALVHAKSLSECKDTLASQLEGIDRLNSVISRLLTLARAESGELPLTIKLFDISPMLAELVDTFSLVASAKEVTLTLEAPPSLEIHADWVWIERAMFNLIDNAIKYTAAGGWVRVVGRHEERSVILEVADSGRGISAQALPHIFERFYRADESRSKDVEGVGLGLSLVKWIVDQHHGTISVDSTPQQGSRFSVKLPAD